MLTIRLDVVRISCSFFLRKILFSLSTRRSNEEIPTRGVYLQDSRLRERGLIAIRETRAASGSRFFHCKFHIVGNPT